MDQFVVEIKISDNNLSYKSDFPADPWWDNFIQAIKKLFYTMN